MKHLSKGKWPQLKWFVIGIFLPILVANKIHDKGCKYVSKGQWPLLKLIGLSKCL